MASILALTLGTGPLPAGPGLPMGGTTVCCMEEDAGLAKLNILLPLLRIIDGLIVSRMSHKVIMCAPGNDLSFINNIYTVCILHGGDPLCNQKVVLSFIKDCKAF